MGKFKFFLVLPILFCSNGLIFAAPLSKPFFVCNYSKQIVKLVTPSPGLPAMLDPNIGCSNPIHRGDGNFTVTYKVFPQEQNGPTGSCSATISVTDGKAIVTGGPQTGAIWCAGEVLGESGYLSIYNKY